MALLALRWLGQGYGYEVTVTDILAAYSHTIEAADRFGRRDETRARIRQLLPASGLVTDLLAKRLKPSEPPENRKKP